MGTRITELNVSGWRGLELRNECLSVIVLPEKGGDIATFSYLPMGVDLLLKTPWGLAPPGAQRRAGTGEMLFLHNYEGGWQTLFPSVNESCTYRGNLVPMHGEVALRAWDWTIDDRHDKTPALRLAIQCRTAPFLLERKLRLTEEPSLVVDDTVTNVGANPAHFVWGHHCVLGPPLVGEGCELDVPAKTIVTMAQPWEDTARMAASQRSCWPYAQDRDGGWIDLRKIPSRAANSHDDAYLTDLSSGRAIVKNTDLGLAFRLDFDPCLYPWLVCWMPYGGTHEPSLRGIYGLGIEPYTSPYCLRDAVSREEAVELKQGHSVSTRLRASVLSAR